MSRYIGLDAHSESCTVAVMGPSGKQVRHERLVTEARALKKFMRTVPRPRHLCMEEGTLSEWLYEELEPMVDELVVVQPDKRPGNKSDLLDARLLADQLRRGAIQRPVYKAPGRFRELREAVRAYDGQRQDLVRCKNQLNARCRSRGLHGLAKSLYVPKHRPEALRQLPAPFRRRVTLLCQQLDALADGTKQAKTWLHEAAQQVPVVARLCTAPGIGIIRASQIVAIVISPHRFRSSRQFWSYCGLAVVTRSSSDWAQSSDGDWHRKRVQQTRGLNKNRQPVLKSVFKGAAIQLARQPDQPLGQAYLRLLQTTKPSLARLTTARRLAAAVLAMWKHGEQYIPHKQHSRR